MSENTEILDNFDNRYGSKSNYYNLHPPRKPTYNKLGLSKNAHESGD